MQITSILVYWASLLPQWHCFTFSISLDLFYCWCGMHVGGSVISPNVFLYSSFPLPCHHCGTGHERKLHYIILQTLHTLARGLGQSTGFSKDISPMATGETHMPHNTPSGQTSDLPERYHWEKTSEFSTWWELGQRSEIIQTHLFILKLQNSTRLFSSSAKGWFYCLPLFLGHFWTHRLHQPYQRSFL